ncbi:MAG TPA: hypothetical protein VG271_07120 [Beijerinckiaceae bacterium]|nr:hypothetical protein [Beijerinckiaceae bacterium]
MLADLMGFDAQEMHGFRMVWQDRQHPPIKSLGLGQPSRLMMLEALFEERGTAFRNCCGDRVSRLGFKFGNGTVLLAIHERNLFRDARLGRA